MDLHPRFRGPDARGGEHPLALNLDHAGAAIAVGAVAGLGQPAQMRDLDAVAVRRLPDRLARLGLDLGVVEKEADRIGHCATPVIGTTPTKVGVHSSDARTVGAWVPAFAGMASSTRRVPATGIISDPRGNASAPA